MKGIPNQFWPVLLISIFISTMACSISDLSPINKTSPSPTTEATLVTTTFPNNNSEPTSKENTPTEPSAIEEQPASPDSENKPAEDINPGIKDVGNYRITLKITGTGKTETGSDITETYTTLEENNKVGNSVHLKNTDNMVTDTTSTTDMDFYVIKDQIFMLDNTTDPASCTIFGSSEDSIETLGGIKPGQLFTSIDKGDLVAKNETVNNLKTDHYSAKNIGMSLGEPTSIQGEVWYAQTGNYIVRFTGKADGKFLLSSDLITGSVTWEYNVTDINQVGAMQEPALCTEEENPTSIDSNDIPVPTNAIDAQIDPDYISFGSPDNPDVILAYFRKELPVKGWTITEDIEVDGAFLIGISKGARLLEITVIPEDPSGCYVDISSPQ